MRQTLALGQEVIVWDGATALPATVTENFTANVQYWAPDEGMAVMIVSPHDAAGHITFTQTLAPVCDQINGS